MWSTQISGWTSFLPTRNATPDFLNGKYGHSSATVCFCAHSLSNHQLHHNGKPELHTCSRYGFFNPLQRMLKSGSGKKEHGRVDGFICNSVIQDNDYVDDEFYMKRAVEIARKAIGHTSPNPMVGCVIVNNGKIVGEGFHPKAGQPHAEEVNEQVFALRDAGDLAENATAYVSLEPCNHYGRTPPCTEALIKAKVKRVVVGMLDPNPIVASKGVARLRDAGITVTLSAEEDICKKLNEAYIHQMLTGKPFLTLRYSLSVNGCFLAQVGDEVADSGGYYSRLLEEYDAVIFSPSSLSEKITIPASKENGAKQPLWIILSNPNTLREIPPITDVTAKVITFTDKGLVVEQKMAQKGIETVVLVQLNLSNILDYCKSQGLSSVLWDLRSDLASHEELFNEGITRQLLRKIVVEVLPVWKKNQAGDSQLVLKSMAESLKLKTLQSKSVGQSVVLEGYLLDSNISY